MISKTGIPESDINEILNDVNIELIVRAAQLNPRDVKRFINIIILSRYIYEQSIGNIAKIIAVQAFYFRGDKWLDFLKLITRYGDRTDFLKHFIIFMEEKGISVSNLADADKLINDIRKKHENFPLNPKFLEIFNKLIELNDNDLFAFLISSTTSLLKIDKMDKYLRAIETSGIIENEITFGLDSEQKLQLLKEGKLTEFKNIHDNLNFHAPFEDLSRIYLKEVNLERTFLFKADLTEADLTKADLTKADLTKAKLLGTNLREAYLTEADLGRADLTGAYLGRADLAGAYLTEANLAGAYLTKANLAGAYLTEANLAGADLAGAKLLVTDFTRADLAGANLTDADLAGGNLTGANLTEADLAGGNLREATLIGADLTEANLTEANLTMAHLRQADLTRANLNGANLNGADLTWGNLTGANLNGANLREADLAGANLNGANLTEADLTGAYLTGANLIGTVLSNSFIISPKDYRSLVINEKTDFTDAIIDDSDFIDYISKFTKIVPQKIENKEKLKIKLEERELPVEAVNEFLEASKLSK